MRRPAALLVLSVTLLAVAACSSGGSGGGGAGPSQSPSASPAARTLLQAAATKAESAQYTGRYRLTSGRAMVNVVIRTGRGGFRYDEAGGGKTASFFVLRGGVFACSVGTHRICLRVASRLGAVPKPFSFGAQLARIFIQYPSALATGTGTVSLAAATPAHGSVPTGSCFQVSGFSSVPDGTYCFGETGVITQVRTPAGELQLTSLSGAPGARSFRLPVSPTPAA